MGKFTCPTCQTSRHIDEGRDPREDHCWACGTPVLWNPDELARILAEWRSDPDLAPDLIENR